MRKMKAIENKSLPDINPNLVELVTGLYFGGREEDKITLSKTR